MFSSFVFLTDYLRSSFFPWSLVVAFIFSSFSFWRRLKEDYREEEIYGLTLFITFCSFFATALGFWILNNTRILWLFAFWGGVAAVKLWSFRFRIDVWEVFEALVLAPCCFLVLSGFSRFLSSEEVWDLDFFIVGLVALASFVFSRSRYRSWAWYKSGKIGFLFWEESFLIFLLTTLLAFLRNDDLYLKMFCVVGTCLAGVMIYFRSERSLKEDFKKIIFKSRK